MLISLVPFIYMAYFYFFVKKKWTENINFDLSYGMRCYCCKDRMLTTEELAKSMFSSDKSMEDTKGLKLCEACERDEQLNKIFDKKSDSKFKRLLISEKYNRLTTIFLVLMVSCIAIDILDIIYIEGNIRYFFLLGQVFQLSFWYILIKRWKYTAIKKPQS
jgi:hypothetical protein